MFSLLTFQALSLNTHLSPILFNPPYFLSFNPKTQKFHTGPLNGKLWTPFHILSCFTVCIYLPTQYLLFIIPNTFVHPNLDSILAFMLVLCFFVLLLSLSCI